MSESCYSFRRRLTQIAEFRGFSKVENYFCSNKIVQGMCVYENEIFLADALHTDYWNNTLKAFLPWKYVAFFA